MRAASTRSEDTSSHKYFLSPNAQLPIRDLYSTERDWAKYKNELDNQGESLNRLIQEKTKFIENELNKAKAEAAAGTKSNQAFSDLRTLEEKIQTLEVSYLTELENVETGLRSHLASQLSDVKTYFEQKVKAIRDAYERKIQQFEKMLELAHTTIQCQANNYNSIASQEENELTAHQEKINDNIGQTAAEPEEPNQFLKSKIIASIDTEMKPEDVKEGQIADMETFKTESIRVIKPFQAEIVEEPSDPDPVELGAEYKVSFTLKNSSNKNWPENTSLVCIGGHYPKQSVSIGSVEPEEEYSLTLTLIAPNYYGVYENMWRLQYIENEKKSHFGPVISFELTVEGADPEETVMRGK